MEIEIYDQLFNSDSFYRCLVRIDEDHSSPSGRPNMNERILRPRGPGQKGPGRPIGRDILWFLFLTFRDK
jgi:hypothetical protein